MSKHIGHILAATGVGVTVEVDQGISDLHVRHDGKSYTIGQPGTYLIVESGHDKHLMLVTTVRKSRWTQSEESSDSPEHTGLPQGQFPYLPALDIQTDHTLID